MHAVTVVNTYLRLGLLNVMQYRADFFMQLVSIAVTLGTALLTIGVVFGQTDNVGGWTEPDLVALIGVQMLVRGITSLVMRPSMERLMENIRMGTLDFMLTKPADSQLLASVAQVNVAASADVVGGGIVLGLALARLGSTIGLQEALLFVVMLLCGVVMVYAFLLATSTLAFWFVRLDNLLVIFNTMFNGAGGWPITIFPAWLKYSLTFMIPVAFAVTVPAQSLTGRLTWPYALGAIGLAIAFALGSRWFWRFGLRHYTGASA
ncbi:MAG TPA: ABC-2 family transporter protein [Thermomicrobiales bacterium]|nr:ABC-2 family transporter protein [Thermomicrobiales bacterium]